MQKCVQLGQGMLIPDSDKEEGLSVMKRTDPTLDDVCRADRAGRISQCNVIEGDISPVRFLLPTFNGFLVFMVLRYRNHDLYPLLSS